MKGIEISRQYFFEIARLDFERNFPDLYQRTAFGLAGNGSECFGYDDELSRDHDWGADFFVWVSESDRLEIPKLKRWKEELFEENPPEYKRTRSEYGAKVGVMTVGDFYLSLIGYRNGPHGIQEWRSIPEENLAMAVNGEVFLDNAGDFSATRCKILNYYPEDLRKKKLAARCMAVAQTGQYNLNRCFLREDWVTYRTVLSRFNDNVIGTVFLLNRVFCPYYKWAYRKMAELPVLGKEVGALLKSIAVTYGISRGIYDKNQSDINEICSLIVGEFRRQKLSFAEDWFLAAHGEAIQASIEDPYLRSFPAQYE